MIEYIAWCVMLVCWVLWALAFVKPRREAAGQKREMRAPSSRWGLGMVFVSFALIWTFVRPAGYHQPMVESIASMILGPASVVLAWFAAHRLGKQWSYEASLREDHELVQTGVYRWLRHPIYTSMLGMFITTGLAWTWWPMFFVGLVLFIAGTEIRIAAEERLLTERFPAYADYRARVKGYVPFIR